MAEIHVMPARRLSPEHFVRLGADLIRAHENGVDLGSRAPHIRAAGEAILDMNDQLRALLDTLSRDLATLGAGEQGQEQAEALRRALDRVAALARSAKNYSPEG